MLRFGPETTQAVPPKSLTLAGTFMVSPRHVPALQALARRLVKPLHSHNYFIIPLLFNTVLKIVLLYTQNPGFVDWPLKKSNDLAFRST